MNVIMGDELSHSNPLFIAVPQLEEEGGGVR